MTTVNPIRPSPAPRRAMPSAGPRRTGAAIAQPPLAHATLRSATHDQFVRSKLNVRRKSTDVAELAALIRAQGLLHNLVAYPQQRAGDATGMLEVVAGGRRLQAIGVLIAEGSLPSDYRSPYLLVTEDEAVAISMAENRGRADMHPADVCVAMLDLLGRGHSAEDIAIGFGLDLITVKRCCKLGRISPRLLALYRDDAANFEHMMALALSDDHATQELAWDSLAPHARHPHALRRLLTAQQIDVQRDPLARFVGLDAIEEAGGTVVRDLFSDSGAGYVADPVLLEGLALAKLEPHAAALGKDGWAWVEVRPRLERSALDAFGKVRMVTPAPTAAQETALGVLDARISELEEALDLDGAAGDGFEGIDDEGDGGAGQAASCQERQSQLAQLRRERRALTTPLAVAHAEDRALAGAIVTIDNQGAVAVVRDLIRPADKYKMAKLAPPARGDGGARRAVHSDRLSHLLSSHRTLALQAELLQRPDLALVVLTDALLTRLLRPHAHGRLAAKLSLSVPALAEETAASLAQQAMRVRREQVGAALPPGDGESWLAWLARQPQSVVLDLLAWCVASALDATQSREGPSGGADIAQLLGLDMKRWWTPSAEAYFDHVSKARCVAVVMEAVSPEAAVALEKMSKAAAARAVAGNGWLPEPLR